MFNYIRKLFHKKGQKEETIQPTSESTITTASQKITSAPKKSSARRTTKPAKSSYILKASDYGIYPHLISRQALQVVEKLQKNGFEAYVVGGCLRDILLAKTPKDFDIATNARPEQIQKIFQRQCRLVGRRFRLAHILFGKEIIEVATFRAAHDEVNNDKFAKQSAEGMLLRDNVYGSLEDDAARRDFTVNAFYYNPQKDQLYDFFNGIKDLRAGRLVLIGDPVQRYQEDPVRMLRAIRFMAKLEMFLDKRCEQPIYELAPLLQNIPAARLFDESLKLLQTGQGEKTYHLLYKYQLFQQLFPVLTPFFTEKGDSFTEKMLVTALRSTDERIADHLRINPAFLFAAFFWYPLRERIEILKNEGGLNNFDAYSLASNDLLHAICQRVAILRRHTATIRDIWSLQLLFTKRTGKRPQLTLEHEKFRAAYDLLAMRAEIEHGETIELAAWWYEYQQSNASQRHQLIQVQQKLHMDNGNSQKRKPRRRYRPNNKRKKRSNQSSPL
ncbi:poly(A) polymerase [Gallibacterium salpingitidis]|uniref:Poly(A) polymerase I n=1 Tax=Gallibacterium salpingitidis TaxID=505341 RepID=A0A1A7NS34_9PAST|nr:poly(A) polymerase [Gallibacterium salpingitidis]